MPFHGIGNQISNHQRNQKHWENKSKNIV
jgi:hypothetical protein